MEIPYSSLIGMSWDTAIEHLAGTLTAMEWVGGVDEKTVEEGDETTEILSHKCVLCLVCSGLVWFRLVFRLA